MIEKLFKMVEDAHEGMCIHLEYYHVIDYVVSIYKSAALCQENRCLIQTQGDLESAIAESYLLLNYYLNMSEKEKNETETLTIEILNKSLKDKQ